MTEWVLVVEDEPMVRKLMCDVLNDAGYMVCEARSPSEAFAMWERIGPAVVVTDQILRGGFGTDLIDTIREEKPDQMFVIMSAIADELADAAAQRDVPLLDKTDYTLIPMMVRALLAGEEPKVAEHRVRRGGKLRQ